MLDIAKISPVVGILAYALYWLKGRIEKKEDEIVELNRQLRESEKSSLEAFQRVVTVLQTLTSEMTISSKEVLGEIKTLKDWLDIRMKGK